MRAAEATQRVGALRIIRNLLRRMAARILLWAPGLIGEKAPGLAFEVRF